MILDTIVARKKQEVLQLKEKGVSKPESPAEPPRGFMRSLLESPEIAIIAEVKKASPSKGIIAPDFEPTAIAASYEKGGAEAISVLTDEKFFQGSIGYIPKVRQTVKLPVIRKDFIIHELQIEEASNYGADAILLIAAILDESQIRDYLQISRELSMDVLVEVHDERELEKSLAAGSSLIGVNNRDLRDFTVDIETTIRLRREIPDSIPVVSESGIKNRDDIRRIQEHGITAVLIGETLMRSKDREAAIRELKGS